MKQLNGCSKPVNKAMNEFETLDTCGLLCPEPLMLLRQKIRKMQAGQIVEVKASDPSTQRDFEKFCKFQQHILLEQSSDGLNFIFRIKKAP